MRERSFFGKATEVAIIRPYDPFKGFSLVVNHATPAGIGVPLVCAGLDGGGPGAKMQSIDVWH